MPARNIYTFDGWDMETYGLVNEVVRTSSVDVSTIDAPSMDGTRYAGSRLKPATVALNIWATDLHAADRPGIVRDIMAHLAVDEPKMLRIAETAPNTLLAIPSGDIQAVLYPSAVMVPVSFLVVDPVAYGSSGSATIPSGSSVSFTVNGTYPTRPKITATSAKRGTGNVWKIALDGGDFVAVTLPTSASTAVEIDCATRAVKVGGAASMISLDSDWLELEPGQHTLSMAIGTGGASVTWAERWL